MEYTTFKFRKIFWIRKKSELSKSLIYLNGIIGQADFFLWSLLKLYTFECVSAKKVVKPIET